MSQSDDILERYQRALESEHALRQQRQEAIASNDFDKMREITAKLIVAQKLRLQLKSAVDELEAIETDQKSKTDANTQDASKSKRISVLWRSLAAIAALLILAWGIVSSMLPTLLTTATSTPTATVTSTAVGLTPSNTDLGGASVKVAVSVDNPPFNFIDADTGEARGWDFETITEICKRLNCEPEFIQTSWDGMLQAIADGDYDMAAAGIAISEERSEQVDFSIPYFKLYSMILAREDEDRFISSDELAEGDFLVGATIGSFDYSVARELVGEERVVTYDNLQDAVDALIVGDIDAVMTDNLTAPNDPANQINVKQINTEFDPQDVVFAFPQGSDLVVPVNTVITEMLSDGTLDDMQIRYMQPLG